MAATSRTTGWHTYQSSNGAQATTQIRDWARLQGWPVDYSRISDTTVVAVQCTTAEWQALLTEAGAR